MGLWLVPAVISFHLSYWRFLLVRALRPPPPAPAHIPCGATLQRVRMLAV